MPLRASKHDAKVDLCERIWNQYCNTGIQKNKTNANDNDDDNNNDDDDNDDDDDDDDDTSNNNNNVDVDRQNSNEQIIDGDDFVDEDGHVDDSIAPTSEINLLAAMDFVNDNAAALDDRRTVLTMLRTRSRARRDSRALPSICPYCDDKNLILRPRHEQNQHIARCEALNKQQT